jgi:Fe-S-cluster containining protein
MTRRFYRDGIRFQCQGSGECCRSRGAYGYVYVSLEDRRRLAAHLGLATSAFTRRYCAQTDGELHLRDPQLDCQFLRGVRCGVYKARPEQCRTWPFWPENMDPRVWREEISACCAGVGRGKLYTAEEIEALLERSS